MMITMMIIITIMLRGLESQWSEAKSLPSTGEVASSSHIHPLTAEEAPFQNTQTSAKNKNMVMGPDGA
jgi:DNA-binding transcriptional regulator YhcF (GntR family)